MKPKIPRETDQVEEKFYIWFVALMAVSLTVIIYYTLEEYHPQWMAFQEKYIEMQAERADHAHRKMIVKMPLKVRQIWLPKWNRADRCITCHMGIDNPAMIGEKHPYRAHPILTLKGWKKIYTLDEYKSRLRHDFSEFGCTICHEGQGRATTLENAHGMENLYEAFTGSDANERGILQPMLPVEMTQASCGKCHDLEDKFPGAPILFRGYELIDDYGCEGCHTFLEEGGGNAGPELTFVGTKYYNNIRGFIRLKRFHSRRFGYLYESLLAPAANMKDSMMADAIELSEEEAANIVVYLLSLQEPISLHYAKMDRKIRLPRFNKEKKPAGDHT